MNLWKALSKHSSKGRIKGNKIFGVHQRICLYVYSRQSIHCVLNCTLWVFLMCEELWKTSLKCSVFSIYYTIPGGLESSWCCKRSYLLRQIIAWSRKESLLKEGWHRRMLQLKLFLDFLGFFWNSPNAELSLFSSTRPTSSIFAYEHRALLWLCKWSQ